MTPDLNFTCSCGADFTGEVCQHHVESICATAPCLNGGTCYEIVNNITDELNPDYPDVPQVGRFHFAPKNCLFFFTK